MVREGIEERERERIDSTKKGGEREDERARREIARRRMRVRRSIWERGRRDDREAKQERDEREREERGSTEGKERGYGGKRGGK